MPPRGRLVEFVRLLFVVLFAAAGYTVATRLGHTAPSRTMLGVALGSATGFVLGGVLGRQTYAAVRSMEQDLREVPAAEVVAGAGGLIAGLAVAALLSVPVFRLPPLAAWTSVGFMYATLGFVGFRVGRTKHEDLFALIGMKPRTAAASGKVFVVDTSALMTDGCRPRGDRFWRGRPFTPPSSASSGDRRQLRRGAGIAVVAVWTPSGS
jgi:uncharacterized protein YacL